MQLDSTAKRLVPIFIAKFLRNLVFWYSIEKLFMATIGYNAASIGMMAALYSVVSILTEVPSGILADRWSRKGVLVLAAASLALSGLTGWAAHDIPTFLISAIFWGMFDAFASGTDTSQLYDTLLEEQGHARNFKRMLGRYELTGGIALIIGSVAGGLIASATSLRGAFLWSIIPAMLAIIFTLLTRETKIHKEEQDTHLFQHIRQTLNAVFRNKTLTWILVSILALAVVNNVIGEMYQLWYLAIGAPTSFYGIAGAIVLSTYGVGGAVTEYFTNRRRVVLAVVVIICADIIATMAHNLFLLVGAQFVIGFLAFTLGLVLTTEVNHQLPSRYRAGAGSAINSVSRMIFIPVSLAFGATAQRLSIFTAAWMLVGLTFIALFAQVQAHIRNHFRRSV